MVVHNPLWLQFMLYLAVAALPCLSGYMLYLGIDAVAQSKEGASAFFMIGAGFAYLTYIAFKLSHFVSATVTFNDYFFCVSQNGEEKTYRWSDIADATNYKSSQILQLFDARGKTIYMVDHMTPGYGLFAKQVNRIINIE